MPAPDLIKDGARQMMICNACRYCEGYCAVFPAMEQRRIFTKADLTYLANLCFDCRDCYYACQYAPPHEFGVNIPKLMADLRADTYRDFSWPAILSGLFTRNGRAVTLVTVSAVIVILFLVLVFIGPKVLFATHLGEGTFYRVVPYVAMTVVPLTIALYGLVVLLTGTIRFWRETGAELTEIVDGQALWRATKDAFGLTYKKGGGVGCNYPDAGFSQSRRWFHHLVFYGFLLDFASTSVAAFYDHFVGWQAPYPFLSMPVVLGTIGGIGLLIGTSGLLYLKWKSDDLSLFQTEATTTATTNPTLKTVSTIIATGPEGHPAIPTATATRPNGLPESTKIVIAIRRSSFEPSMPLFRDA